MSDHYQELAAALKKTSLERDELLALLRQIHEAADKVYQMNDAMARNTLVNIYEISGKVLAIATTE